MNTVVTICDESLSGERRHHLDIAVDTSRMTVRELIRRRVLAEVADYNRRGAEIFHGLVQPTESEATLNGFRMRRHATIDAERQCALALEAFERNGFFVLAGDRQVTGLDDEIDLIATPTINFIRLIPLVGG